MFCYRRRAPRDSTWAAAARIQQHATGRLHDLQGRSAYQPTLHSQGDRWIAYIGHHGGSALNPLTGQVENNGTSILNVTEPGHPVYLAHIPGEPGAPQFPLRPQRNPPGWFIHPAPQIPQAITRSFERVGVHPEPRTAPAISSARARFQSLMERFAFSVLPFLKKLRVARQWHFHG